jgi:hypothetical protein
MALNLDDGLIFVQQVLVRKIVTLLRGLGFIVNHQKSTITVVCLGLTTEVVNGYVESSK